MRDLLLLCDHGPVGCLGGGPARATVWSHMMMAASVLLSEVMAALLVRSQVVVMLWHVQAWHHLQTIGSLDEARALLDHLSRRRMLQQRATLVVIFGLLDGHRVARSLLVEEARVLRLLLLLLVLNVHGQAWIIWLLEVVA